MKSHLSSLRTVNCLLGIIFLSSWTLQSNADVLVGAGQEVQMYEMFGPGGIQQPTQVFDIDTVTGARSNTQNFTQRGAASLMAMDRDSSGTLWAINEPNRLVTVDETTGLVTDVIELTHSSMSFLRFPAIAFVPGEGQNDPDALFAIAKFENFLLSPEPAKDMYLDGFILVQVDIATGEVTPFGMGIGGQYVNNGAGHGLEYDAGLGLIHLWNDGNNQGLVKETKSEVPGGHIELIDPATGLTTQVPSEPDMMVPAPAKANPGDLPSGFQAIVHAGLPGMIYVYERNGNSPDPELFLINITDNGMDGPTYTSSLVSTFQSFSMYGPPSVRAMERRADGGALVIETDGFLEFYEPGLEEAPLKGFNASEIHVLVNQVKTSIGGYSPDFRSLTTDPVSGAIYALSSGPSSRPKSASANKVVSEEPYNGLFIINRNGPSEIELAAFDVPLIDLNADKPMGGGPEVNSPLTEIEAIAFDDLGNLFGVTYNGYLVVIDLPTGVVTEVEIFDPMLMSGGDDWQLDFNPEDGRFYLLYRSHYNYQTIFGSFSRDGSGYAEIPLSEEFQGLSPDSLVFGGGGSFFFTEFENFAVFPSLELKDMGFNGSTFFGLSTSGALTPPQGTADAFYIDALTKLNRIETVQPDVLIGPSKNRLTGDGVYSPSGSGQSVTLREKGKKLKGSFSAAVENDGNSSGAFSVSARGGKNSDNIKYSQGGSNVTAAMKAGYPLQVEPGQSVDFQAKFSRKSGRKFNESFRFSGASGGNVDTGVVKVKLKAPKTKEEIKPVDLSR